MKKSISLFAVCLALAVALSMLGCGRGASPKPVAISSIPSQLDKLFSKAPEPVKSIANQAKGALAVNDLSGAWVALQALSERKDLTKDQQQFLGSAIVSMGAEIEKARQQGDERADDVQRFHRMSK